MTHPCGCPSTSVISDQVGHRQYHQLVVDQGGPHGVVNARTLREARGIDAGSAPTRTPARPPSFLEWRRIVWQEVRRRALSLERFTTRQVITSVGLAPDGQDTTQAVESLLFTAAHDHRGLTHHADGDWQGITSTRPARARTNDPVTSHAAAASISPDSLRLSQRSVLTCLRLLGTGTDEAIASAYHVGWQPYNWPRQSASGLRTRRAELVTANFVVDTGRTELLPSGRA